MQNRLIHFRKGLVCFFLAAGAGLLVLTAISGAEAGSAPVKIGIVAEASAPGFSSSLNRIKSEIDKLTAAEYDMSYSVTRPSYGNGGMVAISNALDRLMNNDQIDMVIAMGVLASDDLVSREKVQKPSIATMVFDAKIQEIPENRTNLAYVYPFRYLGAEIDSFLQIAPSRKVAVIIDKWSEQEIPGLEKLFSFTGDSTPADFVPVSCGKSAGTAVEAIPFDADAVIVMPFLRLDNEEKEKLVLALNQKKLPSFSLWEKQWVRKGLLAGVCPEINSDRIARRVALNVRQILQDKDPGDLPVEISLDSRLMINMATARRLDVPIGWKVRTEALLFDDPSTVKGRIDLLGAVREAKQKNLELAAQKSEVSAGREDARQALARLLPQLTVSSSGIMIDEDRARSSLGLFPERQLSGSASVSQMLYSDSAITRWRVERDLDESRRAQSRALGLDIGKQTALAFIDVLKADAQVRIRKNDLELTRANLVRARNRRESGMAGPAEVYRWESEIASGKRAFLSAESRLRMAKIALNRILARPLDLPLNTIEIRPESPLFINTCRDLFHDIDSPEQLSVFENFMIDRAVERSPEIERIDAAISANEKRYAAAARSRWLPDVFFNGGYTRSFDQSGAGTDGLPSSLPVYDMSTGQPVANQAVVLPDLTTDDDQWHLSVFAVFDLYSGGAIASERRRAKQDMEALIYRRRHAVDMIRAGVSEAVQSAGATYPGIELARSAADSARENLDLVTDAYERGNVSIIDLLEAQNHAVSADLAAETAEYEFLADMVRLQRASGRELYEIEPEEADSLRRQIRNLLGSAGNIYKDF